MYCPECDGQRAVSIQYTIKLFSRPLTLEICLCKDCDWVDVGDWWWKEEESTDEYLKSVQKVTIGGSHSGYRGDKEVSRQDKGDQQ